MVRTISYVGMQLSDEEHFKTRSHCQNERIVEQENENAVFEVQTCVHQLRMQTLMRSDTKL